MKNVTFVAILALTISCPFVFRSDAKESTLKNSTLQAFTGSALEAKNIIAEVDEIFVGKILETGLTSVSSPGRATLSRIKVEVTQVFRGSVTSPVLVRMDIISDFHEEPPLLGNSYIFFVQERNEGVKVLKLIPATDDNLAEIKALIAKI